MNPQTPTDEDLLPTVSSVEEDVRLAPARPIPASGAQIEVRPVADLCRAMTGAKAMNLETTSV